MSEDAAQLPPGALVRRTSVGRANAPGAKVMESDRGKLLFEEMTGKIIEALGIRTERQRLDSTHITSNIARLTRLGLFCEPKVRLLQGLGLP